MANHYSKEDLELYRNHQMSILGRLTCQAHLKECPACAQLLKELSEDDDFIRQLRASAQIYETIVNPPSKKGTHHSI